MIVPSKRKYPFIGKRKQYKIFNDTITFSAWLELEESKILCDEPIYVRYCLETNSVDHTITFFAGGDTRNFLGRSISYTFQLTNVETGEIMGDPYPEIFRMNFGGLGCDIFLNKNKPQFNRELFLPHYVYLTKPGRYILTSKKSIVFTRDGNNNDRSDKIEVQTGQVELEILPLDETTKLKYIQSRIDEFETSKDYDVKEGVMKKLVHFSPYPTLLPFFSKIVKDGVYVNDGFVSRALSGLEKFKCEEGVKGIMGGYEIDIDEVRKRCTTNEVFRQAVKGHYHSISCYLARSKSPYGIDYLCRYFGKSENKSVQNCFVNRCDKIKRFIVFEVYWRLYDSEEDWTRKVSRKYIDSHPITEFRNQLRKEKTFSDVIIVCKF